MLRSSDTSMAAAGTPRSSRPAAANRIMISGPHTKAAVPAGSTRRWSSRRVTTPTSPHQPGSAWSTVTCTSTSNRLAPAQDLIQVEHAGRRAGTDQDGHPAERAAVGEHGEHDGPQRRQTDATGDDDHIAPLGPVHRPRGAERPPHAEDVTHASRAQRLGRRTDGADGVPQRSRRRGVAADGDRHLAAPERPQHVELAGRAGQQRRVLRHENEGHGVGQSPGASRPLDAATAPSARRRPTGAGQDAPRRGWRGGP